MKIGMETMWGFQYKLRMVGVTILVPLLIYGDNMSVIHNTQRTGSMLKKNSNSICYHAIRESVAKKESLKDHVPSVDNPAEICTKVVPGGAKQKNLIGKVLHDLYEH